VAIFLYKTTNLANGKFYYGIHTGPLEETAGRLYLGSGILIKQAIKKYGRQNFKREVLEIFDDYSSAYLREAEVVNEELVNDPNCYNLKPGGRGGVNMTAEQKAKIGEWSRNWIRPPNIGQKIGDSLRGVKKTAEHKAALRKPKQMTTKTCPHCGTIGAGANMTRYHFNNCKVKK
jgi:hypothetical protein